MIFALLQLVVAVVALAVARGGCTKEEYLAKFGASYEINVKGAEVEPGLEGNYFVGQVSYETTCSNGGSKFTTMFKEGGDMPFSVLIATRLEPKCAETEKVEPFEYTGVVAIDLTANGKENAFDIFSKQQFSFIAFPPDGEYETYDLKSRDSTVDKALFSVTSVEPTSIDAELSVRTSSKINDTDQDSVDDAEAATTIAHVMDTAESEL
jgi:hypothetical protein